MASLLNMSGGSLLGKGGLLPSGYTQLEYIESTGTQYIDTGYAWVSQNRRVFIDITKTVNNVANTHFFGSSNLQGSAANYFDLNPYINHAGDPLTTYVGYNYYGSIPISLNTRGKYEFELKSNKTLSISYNSEVIYDSIVSNIPTTQVSVYLLHVHVLGKSAITYPPFVGKIYAYKMWDDGTFVRNLIPAKRQSNNAVGMYDLINNTFYTNAGTGDFIAGPEV